MGKKDTVTKEYMSKRQYFTDAFNSSVFDGKQIIKADDFITGFWESEWSTLYDASLVVYFGSDKWDGPRSLKEMFPEDIDSEILNEVEDYRLHLIVPSEITDFSKFKTDLGKAMKYIAVSESRSEMSKLSEDEMFRTVGADTVRLINECTGSNIEVEEEEEVVDMCNGLRELLEEERQKGRDEVICPIYEKVKREVLVIICEMW